jgi:hypothetical protein
MLFQELITLPPLVAFLAERKSGRRMRSFSAQLTLLIFLGVHNHYSRLMFSMEL